MITERDIQKIVLRGEKLQFVKESSRKLERGGKSSVYSNHEERMRNLVENQLTGQVGEAVVCIRNFDFDKYVEKVYEECEPGQGDFGRDIPGTTIPIDIKSSNVKVGFNELSVILNKRRLIVSKREMGPNSIYIGVALEKAPSHRDREIEAWIMGWCWGRKLKWEEWTEKSGREREGYRLKYRNLEPMSKMKWKGLLEVPQVA